MRFKPILIISFLFFIWAGITHAQDKVKLTLDECIELGIENNFDVKKANYDFLSSKEATEQVRSQYEPSVNAQAGRTDFKSPEESSIYGTRIKTDSVSVGLNKKFYYSGGLLSLSWQNEKEDSDSSLKSINPSYESTMSLSYSQPLVNNPLGENDRKTIRVSELGEDIASLSLTARKNALVNRIEKAYLDMNFAKKDLAIQEVFLERAKKLLAINRKKLKDGLIEEVDVIATEAAVTLREASILLAEDAVKNATDNLINIIGLDSEKSYSFAEIKIPEGFNHIEVIEEKVLADALTGRPDLRIIERSIQISTLTSEIKKDQVLPSLSLDTQYSLIGYGNTWNNNYNSLEPTWYVGLSLNFFPFMKYTTSASRESEYSHSKNLAGLEEKKLSVITESKTITRRINTQALYVRASLKALGLQKRKLKLEEIKFNQGRSSIQWVLNFQDDLSSAEIEFHKALTDYYKAHADLRLITGAPR